VCRLCFCLDQSLAPETVFIRHGMHVMLLVLHGYIKSTAMWRVCAIALSFVSGWRAFSSVSLCKYIKSTTQPCSGAVYVRLHLVWFPAGGRFLSSLSVQILFYRERRKKKTWGNLTYTARSKARMCTYPCIANAAIHVCLFPSLRTSVCTGAMWAVVGVACQPCRAVAPLTDTSMRSTFGQLTGGEGDADLLLTLDKQVLFTEGILMSVRYACCCNVLFCSMAFQ
jgi:hypothetical protein